MWGLSTSVGFAQTPPLVSKKPIFRLSPVAEDQGAIVRKQSLSVGSGKPSGAALLRIDNAPPSAPVGPAPKPKSNRPENRIRVSDDAQARPIRPAPSRPGDESDRPVAPVGFTVELNEPPMPAATPAALSSRESVYDEAPRVLPAANYEEPDDEQQTGFADDDDLPAPPRRTDDDEDVPPPPAMSDEDELDSKVKKASDCEQTYNDRDCCEEDDLCNTQSHRIRSRVLRNYGKDLLDITPKFRPETGEGETPAEYAKRRDKALAKADSRQWKDRTGNVVAAGKFVDLRNGRVIVEAGGGSQELYLHSLSDDDQCFVAAWWNLPHECTLGDDTFQSRQWASSTFAWKASGLCHKPLYWEDIQLERYGHTVGPVAQPFVSGAHFFGTIFVMPYKMGINPPNECQYALGTYRPGNCAPRYISPLPLSRRGALLQASTVLGLIWLTP